MDYASDIKNKTEEIKYTLPDGSDILIPERCLFESVESIFSD